MIPLLALAGVAGWWAVLRFRARRAARAAAADRAELSAHAEFVARMRGVAAGDVVLLEARRRARLAVQRASLAADMDESVGSSDV